MTLITALFIAICTLSSIFCIKKLKAPKLTTFILTTLLCLGAIEINYGFSKGAPLMWVTALLYYIAWLAIRFTRALINYTKSNAPTNTKKSFRGQYRGTDISRDLDESELKVKDFHESGSNGRGGENPIIKENDPHGWWF